MACKYESSQMANEIAVSSHICVIDFGKTAIVARNIITRDSYLYVLGACFGIDWLEAKYRSAVVRNSDDWIFSPTGQSEMKLLLKWAPQKLCSLLLDARVADNYQQSKDVDAVRLRGLGNFANAKNRWDHMHSVIAHTKEVSPPR
jgi:hypothetical protein